MTTRACIICSKSFVPKNRMIITCGSECSRARKLQTSAAYNKAKYEARCGGARNGRREADDDKVRRQCREGSERYRRALVAAGYKQFAEEQAA